MRLVENGRLRFEPDTWYTCGRSHYGRLVLGGFNNNRIFDVETDLMNITINLTAKIFMNREFTETSSQTLMTVRLEKKNLNHDLISQKARR